jgi:hypothetical protein
MLYLYKLLNLSNIGGLLLSRTSCLVVLILLYVDVQYFVKIWTEYRGRVVKTPALCLGGSGFKSRPGHRLSYLMFSWFFSVPPGESRDKTLNYVTSAFFQLLSSTYHSTLYSLSD